MKSLDPDRWRKFNLEEREVICFALTMHGIAVMRSSTSDDKKGVEQVLFVSRLVSEVNMSMGSEGIAPDLLKKLQTLMGE